jgi:hypothetical protein
MSSSSGKSSDGNSSSSDSDHKSNGQHHKAVEEGCQTSICKDVHQGKRDPLTEDGGDQ